MNDQPQALGRRLLRGGITAALGRSAVAACTLLVNVLIARQLSPTDTGLFILALSLITSAAVLADLGLGKTVLRTIPALLAQGDGAGLKVHLRHVFMLGALTALAGYLLLTGWPGQWLVGLVAGGTGLLALLPLIGLWLVVTLLLNLLAEIWRGFHRVDAAILFAGEMKGLGNLFIVGTVLVGCWLLAIELDLPTLFWAWIASGLLLSCIASAGLVDRLQGKAGPSRVSLRATLSAAWPLWITSAAWILIIQAEIWILGYYRPADEVATYGLAARFAALVGFSLTIVNSFLPPLISELHALADMARLQRMLRAAAGLTTIPAALLFLLLLAWGEPLSVFLFGDFYRGAGTILVLLACGQLVNVAAGSGGFTLQMTGNAPVMMVITLANGTLTLVIGIWLARTHGAIGMAIASMLGMVTQNLAMLLAVRARLGIWIHAGLSGIRDVRHYLRQRI